MSLASDLAVMLEGAPGSAVVKYNGASTWGILDRGDGLQSSDGVQVQVRTTSLLIASAAFTNVHDDARIVVADVPYVIRWHDLEDDGALLRLVLAEAL